VTILLQGSGTLIVFISIHHICFALMEQSQDGMTWRNLSQCWLVGCVVNVKTLAKHITTLMVHVHAADKDCQVPPQEETKKSIFDTLCS